MRVASRSKSAVKQPREVGRGDHPPFLRREISSGESHFFETQVKLEFAIFLFSFFLFPPLSVKFHDISSLLFIEKIRFKFIR